MIDPGMPPDTTQPPIEVDPKFQKVVAADAPAPVKMMAARGIVPGAGPRDLLLIQYLLTFDAAEPVANAAKKALNDAPPQILKGAVDGKTHPGVLDLLVRGKMADEETLEFLVLKKQISDDTLMFVAETCPSRRIVEIIAQNQERLLQNTKILDSLKKNPVTPISVIDVTVAFLQMAGVLPTGAEARAQGLPDKIDEKMVEAVVNAEEFDDSLTKEKGEGEEAEEEEKASLQTKIAAMPISKKVKLAYRGNKESRGLLIRDSNRVVVTAVLNSGKVTDGEARIYSKNRTISSDVLRWISGNRDFVKDYEIRRNLAFNPKTPQDCSLKQLSFLRVSDLQQLARETGVPMVIKNQARTMFENKSAQRSGGR